MKNDGLCVRCATTEQPGKRTLKPTCWHSMEVTGNYTVVPNHASMLPAMLPTSGNTSDSSASIADKTVTVPHRLSMRRLVLWRT